MKLVLVESPYRGKDYRSLELNLKYGRACLRDCFLRGEAPFASHLLYTQENVLDDKNLENRKLGIEAGWAWGRKADLSAVYIDLIDNWNNYEGIAKGVDIAEKLRRPVEFRNLPDKVLMSLDSGIIGRRRNKEELVPELYSFLDSLKNNLK